MKEGLKSEIKLLYNQLQNKSKWYLDVLCPEEESIQDIATVAKENADYELTSLTPSALYSRYLRWRESDSYIRLQEEPKNEYYDQFLSDISFDIASESLDKEERPVFEDSCSMVFKWINQC